MYKNAGGITEEAESSKVVLDAYLSFVSAVADCLKNSCAPIGTPYHLRLNRMRGRLAYDPSPEFFVEATRIIEQQLRDFASQSSAYVALHGTEFRKAVEGLLETVRVLGMKQDYYCARLRQFATQMETTAYPTDPAHLADVVQLQAMGLQSCVESLSHDWQSLLGRMKVELVEAEARIAEADITDPITGLMNRREMERQIQAQRAQGIPEVLIRFSFDSGLRDEIVQQMAQRLVSQFRHNDLISRWSGTDFLVLFRSTPEIAMSRLDHIVGWAGGRYLADTGSAVVVRLEGHLVTYDEALAL